MITEKGEETADGSMAAAMIVSHRRDNAPVVVDVGGGYGGAVTLRLKDNGIPHIGFNGAAPRTSTPRTASSSSPTSGPRRGGSSGKNSTPIRRAVRLLSAA
jgi:hypothetical protein